MVFLSRVQRGGSCRDSDNVRKVNVPSCGENEFCFRCLWYRLPVLTNWPFMLARDVLKRIGDIGQERKGSFLEKRPWVLISYFHLQHEPGPGRCDQVGWLVFPVIRLEPFRSVLYTSRPATIRSGFFRASQAICRPGYRTKKILGNEDAWFSGFSEGSGCTSLGTGRTRKRKYVHSVPGHVVGSSRRFMSGCFSPASDPGFDGGGGDASRRFEAVGAC